MWVFHNGSEQGGKWRACVERVESVERVWGGCPCIDCISCFPFCKGGGHAKAMPYGADASIKRLFLLFDPVCARTRRTKNARVARSLEFRV